MAQVYQMMLGTSGRQYEQLTVKDDGAMMLYFRGTDRSVTQQVTVVEDGAWKGWLKSEKGSMWPGLQSGRWQLMEDGRGKMEDVQGTVPAVGSEAESERTTEGLSPMCAEPIVPVESEPTLRGQSPCNPSSATHTGDSPREPRPRRQRKPRKPRVEHQTSAIDHQPIPADAPTRSLSAISPQTSSTLKALGMVSAASVALLVIYETGLLIPLGLIGLATSGFVK